MWFGPVTPWLISAALFQPLAFQPGSGFSFFADVGGAQVLATDKSAGEEIDFKYAIIGTALGFAISASFLALKICLIRKHLTDDDSSDLKTVHLACNDTIVRKKRPSRDAQVIEL